MHISFTVTKGKMTMKELIKNNIKYLTFLAIFGILGGYFTALYSIQILDQKILDETVAKLGSVDVLIAVSTIQSLGYSLILGIIGKFLAKKIGLWRKVSFEKKGNIELVLFSLIGGAAFILLDIFIFGNFSEVIKNSYSTKPTLEYIIASVTYGAVVEEVMLRLFMMSLIAYIIKKAARKEEMTDAIIIVANIIAALLFTIGHLPATFQSISPVTPMIIFRCFLLNGGFGLIFGRLYRKYGIHYAMLAHCAVHVISKLIWILYI